MTNSLPKLLITGANGQLGTMLQHKAPANLFDLQCCSRQTLDITNGLAVREYLTKHQPAIVVNAAAYTAVDKAEDDQEQALNINANGAANLAKACADLDIPLIHISTDYVFSGTQNKAISEDENPAPLNIYGHSKLLGEQAVQKYCDKYIILRICAVYSEFGHNFYKTICRLARERTELNIVADQIACPTYAGDIAETIFKIAKQLSHYGIYHYCSQTAISWHGFASAIVATLKQHENIPLQTIHAITATEFGARAHRSAFSILDCSKIAKDYGIIQPDWKNSLWL